MTMKLRVILTIVIVAGLLMGGKAKYAEAITCCDPGTQICIMLFDPSCDLYSLCSPNLPIDVTIMNPAEYKITCSATARSFSIAQGSVIIDASGTLRIL
ncbi:MAG: hypothetical protein FD174_4078 [Geobacteraceae bacterium]|nr:MAG: hypothetical protein FD174_4078 [Geobacteraceae bacterium]